MALQCAMCQILNKYYLKCTCCKPGGKVVVLELAKPSMFGFKQLYNFYFSYILPIIGKLSKDNSSYAWLPESLRRYPHQSEILEIWKSLGYENAPIMN